MRLLSRRTRPRLDSNTIVVPPRCREVAAALIDDGDVLGAVDAAADDYADVAEDLDTFLDDIDLTVRAVRGEGASNDLIRAGARAWADRFLREFNCLTCADPLTGMHTIHHLQTCLEELYGHRPWCADSQEGRAPDADHVLVLVDLEPAPRWTHGEARLAAFEHKLRLAVAAEVITDHLPQAAHPVALSMTRIVVVSRRAPQLADQVMALRLALDTRLGLTPSRGQCKVWIEALPGTLGSARLLIDELAR